MDIEPKFVMNRKPTEYIPAANTVGSAGKGLSTDPLMQVRQNGTRTERSIERVAVFVLLGIAAAVFIIHFLFFRHSFPPINTDEASFFSPAQSLAKEGNLASDVHQNFLPGAGKYTYWMPPLYAVLLGSFFKLFGSTVMAAKVFSLLLTCGSALLLASLAKDRHGKASAAALFLICPFIIITSAFIRVEALAIFLTALAILAVQRNGADWLLGMIAALGLMTHPLMLACAAGLGLTSLRRGVKPLFFFLLGFAVAISPYIWYVLQDVDDFKQQMTLQFMRKAKAKLFDLKAMYLLQSVPMVLGALFCLYKARAEAALRLFLAVSVVLALVIVLRSNEFNYQVYLVPYTIAALLLAMGQRPESVLFRRAAPLLLFGFFSALLISKLIKYRFRTDKDFTELIAQLDAAPSWKGKTIFVGGGPDVATYLLMKGAAAERQVPVPQPMAPDWFDKYNYVIEVRENGGENVYEEEGKPRPWQTWRATSFTTADSAYTMTQYQKH